MSYDLSSMSLSALATAHNLASPKPVKKFSSKDEAVRRTQAALDAANFVYLGDDADGAPTFGPQSSLTDADLQSAMDAVSADMAAKGLVLSEPALSADDYASLGLEDPADEVARTWAVMVETDDGSRTILEVGTDGDSVTGQFLTYVGSDSALNFVAVELFDGTRTTHRWTREDGVVAVEPTPEADEEPAEGDFVKATKAELDAMSKDERQAYRKARRKAARDRRKAS